MPFFEIDLVRASVPLEEGPNCFPLRSRGRHSGPPNEKEEKMQQSVDLTNTVAIVTDPEGHNAGRAYYLRAPSADDCRRIATDLASLSAAAKGRFLLQTRWERFRHRLKAVYDSGWVQALVGALILAVTPPAPRPRPSRVIQASPSS